MLETEIHRAKTPKYTEEIQTGLRTADEGQLDAVFTQPPTDELVKSIPCSRFPSPIVLPGLIFLHHQILLQRSSLNSPLFLIMWGISRYAQHGPHYTESLLGFFMRMGREHRHIAM